jgi:hypothetical protein
MPLIDPAVARIFRITHVNNIRWVLEHGLHCKNGDSVDPNFVEIGNPDLILSRARRSVPVAPGGLLSDYIPFYFTPHSPMLYNIKTGMRVARRPMRDIAIMASSLPALAAEGVPFVFTDRHANLQTVTFSTDLTDLNKIDWKILQARDFARDPNDPGKMERYQAEALIHKHLPAHAIRGIVCHGPAQRDIVQGWVDETGIDIQVLAKPEWYF